MNRVVAFLFVALLASACAPRVTLTDTLALYQAGRYRDVVTVCEEELARWRAVDPDVTRAAPQALETIERAFREELVLAPLTETQPGPSAAAALGAGALDAGGGGGGAVRALAADLLSRSPLRIVRAAQDAAELGLVRLAPHLIAVVYGRDALDGEPGPLSPFPSSVRMLAVKSFAVGALRRLLGIR